MLRRLAPLIMSNVRPPLRRQCVKAKLTVLLLAFLSACSRTEGWKEDVLLASGETLTIERRETHAPDAFFQPGRGPTRATELVAHIPPYGVVSYKFESGNYPLLLDRVDGKLWVALPIFLNASCESPLESVMVMTYAKGGWTQGGWTQVSLALAPTALRVNLDQTDRWWRPGDEERYPRPHVTLAEKRALSPSRDPLSGMSIHDASALARHVRRSCK
jgi:hypothetical protein